MAEFLFVADKPHVFADVWISNRPFRHYVEDVGYGDFWLGCQIGTDGRVEVFLRRYDPRKEIDLVNITSRASYHRESDLFAARRALDYLGQLKSSRRSALTLEHVESAYAAGTRHSGQTKNPGRIVTQSQLIIGKVGQQFHAQTMERTIGNIASIIVPIVRKLKAWLSPESFYREFESGLLPLQSLEACDKILVESQKQHRNEPFTLGLFEPEDYARMAAGQAIRADKELRAEP